MPVKLTKNCVDLGIVVSDAAKALAFYRDTLGFEHVEDLPLGNGALMHRLACGESFIKLVVPSEKPPAAAPPGGIFGATGNRYWTVSVSNLAEVVKSCEAAGYKLPVPVTELSPGLTIAFIEDPDGNWVEFLQRAEG